MHVTGGQQQALKLSALRWSAGLSLAFILLATLLIWWNVRQATEHHLAEDLQADAAAIAGVIESVFIERIHTIDRMGLEWETAGGIQQERWDRDAELTATRLDGIQFIALAGADGEILRIQPRKVNAEAIGRMLKAEPKLPGAMALSRTSGNVAVTGRLRLARGGEGLLIVRALRVGDLHTGYLIAALR
ncbi:MAG: hypothetical protein FGM62_09650, partial [Methylobacterium sp.]|nr:hypothetical protein [Methylobacterium sp.]